MYINNNTSTDVVYRYLKIIMNYHKMYITTDESLVEHYYCYVKIINSLYLETDH